MPYVDLIPSVMPISLTSLANGATYRSEAFNVGDKMEIGIVIKADQALSVRVAYGASSDTAATAGTGTSASLPFVTAATSFASSAGSAEAGTYHSIAIPPSARKAQLVITNSSGSTANSITVDAALRRQAYPSNASNVTSGLLPLAYGGTNADLSATGGTGHVLKQSSAGAAVTVGALTASDVQLTSPVTTGGTSTAYTLTDTRIGTPADGQVFAFRVHTLSGTNPTLSVNGGTARNLKYRAWSGSLTSLTAQYLQPDQVCIVVYRSATTDFEVLVGSLIHPGAIPGQLNATQFNGQLTMSGAGITMSGSPSSAGASVRDIHGGGNANDWYFNCPTGGKFSATVNGTEYFHVNSDGAYSPTYIRALLGIHTGGSNNELKLSGGAGAGGIGNASAGAQYHVANSAYPFANLTWAPLRTRTASTAIALCPVATGDMAYVTILESSIASCKVKVDTAGTVTFTDLDGNAASASIVNSSSPAASEYGVYISAGVLYFKGGSSYAGKMASFPQIGKT